MTAAKRRGRPVGESAPGKRAGLSLRVAYSLKKRLVEAVRVSGRSLSQEAELRLEQSFELEALSAVAEQRFQELTAEIHSAIRRLDERERAVGVKERKKRKRA
jgi:ATP-dependent RNA circularization protein (DNA/RNA ligase family)